MKSDRFLVIYSATISTIILLLIISLFALEYLRSNSESDAIEYL